MRTPGTILHGWLINDTTTNFIDEIKGIQTEAYNQALDDLINELGKSSLPVRMKEVISQMAQMIKK